MKERLKLFMIYELFIIYFTQYLYLTENCAPEIEKIY
jgi:hypothetical protein